jgi:hypothetical protein
MISWSHLLSRPIVIFFEVLTLVTLVMGLEWNFLQTAQDHLTKWSLKNDHKELAVKKFEAEVLGIKASAPRIDALFARLSGSILSGNLRNRGIGDGLAQEAPPSIQPLLEAGAVAKQSKVSTGETAVIYEVNSSRLELHRLVPLIVEEENSNAFLYVDHLLFARPKSVGAFSTEPTYLNARFSIRLLIN